MKHFDQFDDLDDLEVQKTKHKRQFFLIIFLFILHIYFILNQIETKN